MKLTISIEADAKEVAALMVELQQLQELSELLTKVQNADNGNA